MLYSSSRDSLKKTLGMGYFPTDYYANEKSDMTWQVYSKGLDKSAAPLSATEVLKKEEAAMEKDTGNGFVKAANQSNREPAPTNSKPPTVATWTRGFSSLLRHSTAHLNTTHPPIRPASISPHLTPHNTPGQLSNPTRWRQCCST